MKKEGIKEIVFYGIILFIIILFVILNNVFWKVGKEENIEQNNTIKETQYLEEDNITYNVPFEEKWLD